MMFLMRMLRTDVQLPRFRVVVVTERHDLERQLAETSTLIGKSVLRPTSAQDLKRELRRTGPDIVPGMLQKQRNRGAAGASVSKSAGMP
jgi:type I restriction enzyme R subunit